MSTSYQNSSTPAPRVAEMPTISATELKNATADVFEQVAAELRTVYSIAYSPANLNFDGRFRRIRVQVNRPDVGIRTRPGYYGR